MAKRPEEAMADMLANLKKTTGRALEEWYAIVAKTGLTKPGQIIDHLKAEFTISHGFARQIAIKVLERLRQDDLGDVDPIDAMFEGKKADLRPIYDLLLSKINAFGPDVDLAIKKGYVSLRRAKQFAMLQPSTATRLDVGIQLKGVIPTARLEESGSFNGMFSHRVRVTSLGEVNAELVGWLKQAYDKASE